MSPPTLTSLGSTHGRVKSRRPISLQTSFKKNILPPFLKQVTQVSSRSAASHSISNQFAQISWHGALNLQLKLIYFLEAQHMSNMKAFLLEFWERRAEHIFISFLIKLVSLTIAVCLFLVLMILPGVCTHHREEGGPSSPHHLHSVWHLSVRLITGEWSKWHAYVIAYRNTLSYRWMRLSSFSLQWYLQFYEFIHRTLFLHQ